MRQVFNLLSKHKDALASAHVRSLASGSSALEIVCNGLGGYSIGVPADKQAIQNEPRADDLLRSINMRQTSTQLPLVSNVLNLSRFCRLRQRYHVKHESSIL